MTKRIAPLIAATFLSITWAGPAQAATVSESGATAQGGVVVAAANAAQAKAKPKPSKGLCERLGGVFGIAAVVNRFSDAILVNPALNQNPALVAWNQNEAPTRLPGLKVMRTIWFSSMVGCDQVKFFGLPLEEAHDRFNLTQAEFAEVGAEATRALQFYNVAQADIDEVVRIYLSSMGDVVSSSKGAKEVRPPR
jgi:hemoglobin